MNKKAVVILAFSSLAVIVIAVFCLYRYQAGVSRDFASVFNGSNASSINFASSTPSALNNTVTTQKEIDQLRKELEDLKGQTLKPGSQVSLPAYLSLPDLKNQDELAKAQQRISSLERQLQDLKEQATVSPAAGGDANLIQSWRAGDKVVQIACQDRILGGWQLGSGVLISEDGKILTNQHVVQLSTGLPDYCLALFSKDYDAASQTYKREYRAGIAGFFGSRDAVLLKINDVVYQDASGQIQAAPVINFFQYFRPAAVTSEIGDAVYVIGFPESAKFSFSVTKGIISNLSADDYFGTDAQIDRGNSGGAAVNAAGQLIGLPTYKYAGGGDYRGYILDIRPLNL